MPLERHSPLGQSLTYGAFPVTFTAAMVVALHAIDQNWHVGGTLAGITLITILSVALFERILPEYPDWNRARGDVGVDAIHGLVSMVLLPEGLKLILLATLLTGSAQLSEMVGFALWPHDGPWLLQLALAMTVSQFGEYWVHRLAHTTPLLWRLHATHHSPHRLYFFNAGRFHPLDTMLSYLSGTVPLLLLGAGPEVLLLVAAWISVHGLYQHCNVHLRLGPLNYVFSMAELHRWHHSLKLEEANTNFGNNIILWDLVFGTFFHPRDRDAPQSVGLTDLPDFPQDYLGQLMSPIRWSQFEPEN